MTTAPVRPLARRPAAAASALALALSALPALTGLPALSALPGLSAALGAAALAASAAAGASPVAAEALFTRVFSRGAAAYPLLAPPDWQGLRKQALWGPTRTLRGG